MNLGNSINKPDYKATMMTGHFASSDFRAHYTKGYLSMKDVYVQSSLSCNDLYLTLLTNLKQYVPNPRNHL